VFKKFKAVVGAMSNVQKVALIVASCLVPVEGYVAASSLPPIIKGFILAEVGVAIALLYVLYGVSPVPPVPQQK
jgi:hypothetical protein